MSSREEDCAARRRGREVRRRKRTKKSEEFGRKARVRREGARSEHEIDVCRTTSV